MPRVARLQLPVEAQRLIDRSHQARPDSADCRADPLIQINEKDLTVQHR
jgi:hypothetical protein